MGAQLNNFYNKEIKLHWDKSEPVLIISYQDFQLFFMNTLWWNTGLYKCSTLYTYPYIS